MVVRVPERRILKGLYLLSGTAYDSGNRGTRLLDVQRARGTAQSWVAVLPSLRTELRALDLFLGPSDAGGNAVEPQEKGPRERGRNSGRRSSSSG